MDSQNDEGSNPYSYMPPHLYTYPQLPPASSEINNKCTENCLDPHLVVELETRWASIAACQILNSVVDHLSISAPPFSRTVQSSGV
jgi:hypothetical protein